MATHHRSRAEMSGVEWLDRNMKMLEKVQTQFKEHGAAGAEFDLMFQTHLWSLVTTRAVASGFSFEASAWGLEADLIDAQSFETLILAVTRVLLAATEAVQRNPLAAKRRVREICWRIEERGAPEPDEQSTC